ncbi:PEF-CTERM protein sorting domain-containing protein [Methanolobus profundi]|uniref:PEF-CTERM protein sorting domain-containing protein n=2 Tax=Methanolobus profundi TaxID=487685 RepID=A0A1I4TPP8_9EURY|nr:PEF-CTERM protein sorting domain-containing protein [Methanolobus profundi]
MNSKKLRFGSTITTILVIAVCLCMLGQSASALPSSSNVAIIGGPTVVNGGTLPTTGPTYAAFTFTTVDPATVNAATLAPYDTVVLNMAGSVGMLCNANALSPSQKADIVAFVGNGNKLIIYDSECSAIDYSWLPYPFTTANPGALGATGTLTIVEENTLSTALPGPYYIDAATLASTTDAVGDMNVMTTYDPNWCLDMSGTNAIAATGPVHTYAKYPAGTDNGLIIYNGLDVDYMGWSITELDQIWLQELQQPFSPSNLPCGVTVVGISLSPASDVNPVGTQHTVTATITDLLGTPIPGIDVTFNVTSGPNAGESGIDTTDGSGEATFTYTGDGGVGTDQIVASFYDSQRQTTVESQTVTKDWEEGGNGEIPEFPTIAVPVIAIIGLALFFQRRN